MDYEDGLTCFLAGVILTATIVGAVIGIPLALVGAVILAFTDNDAVDEPK